jgi:hypothetical protein
MTAPNGVSGWGSGAVCPILILRFAKSACNIAGR